MHTTKLIAWASRNTGAVFEDVDVLSLMTGKLMEGRKVTCSSKIGITILLENCLKKHLDAISNQYPTTEVFTKEEFADDDFNTDPLKNCLCGVYQLGWFSSKRLFKNESNRIR